MYFLNEIERSFYAFICAKTGLHSKRKSASASENNRMLKDREAKLELGASTDYLHTKLVSLY